MTSEPIFQQSTQLDSDSGTIGPSPADERTSARQYSGYIGRLGKADNIPFNQLYYIAKNCADHYYSKIIKTFVALLKCQFTDRQLLLVNTARSLKFLEDYVDRQAVIWKIFQRHETIPDDIQDFHLHIDDFKSSIEKEFTFLKEATHKNIENFQSSLNLQQMYSAALCSHIN